MSTRRAPQKNSWEKAGTRVRQRAMSGTEASTVGFVLVLYVLAGAGLGYLADKFLETDWIVAAGVLLGSALGFREMFRMIKKISRIDAAASEEQETSEFHHSASSPHLTSPEYSAKQSAPQNAEVETAVQTAKPRVFQVPPPPTASFDNPDNNSSSPS